MKERIEDTVFNSYGVSLIRTVDALNVLEREWGENKQVSELIEDLVARMDNVIDNDGVDITFDFDMRQLQWYLIERRKFGV